MLERTTTVRWCRALVLLAFALLLVTVTRRAQAMPMFARKYKLNCDSCHAAPSLPRLTPLGYKFRRAGFRMPDQIGEEELADFDLGNYFSGRLRSDFAARWRSGAQELEGEDRNYSTFSMPDLTLYPLTGSFQKHWATLAEIGLAPDETPEIENAYVRGVWGAERFWFEARSGIFHPIEGFGASDRPLGVSYPLFQTQGAQRTQDTLFRMTGLDRVGAEAGLQWWNTSLTVQVVNGLKTVAREGEIAATGITPLTDNRKDLMVFVNQILGDRSGVSLYWAHGITRPPIDEAAFIAGTSEDTWSNLYDRLAGFGSFGVGPMTFLGGASLGFDQSRDPATGAKSRFRSGGAFVEVDGSLSSGATAFVRLDYFDPSFATSRNDQRAITVGGVLHGGWVYLTPELRYVALRRDEGTAHETSLVVRASVIY